MGLIDNILGKGELNTLKKRKEELINIVKKNKNSEDLELSESIAKEIMEIENKIKELTKE